MHPSTSGIAPALSLPEDLCCSCCVTPAVVLRSPAALLFLGVVPAPILVRFDWLAQWQQPARCTVHVSMSTPVCVPPGAVQMCLGLCLVCAAVCLRVTRPEQFLDASQVRPPLQRMAAAAHAPTWYACALVLFDPAPPVTDSVCVCATLCAQASGSLALSLLTGAPRAETDLLLLPPSHPGSLHLAMLDRGWLSAGACVLRGSTQIFWDSQ